MFKKALGGGIVLVSLIMILIIFATENLSIALDTPNSFTLISADKPNDFNFALESTVAFQEKSGNDSPVSNISTNPERFSVSGVGSPSGYLVINTSGIVEFDDYGFSISAGSLSSVILNTSTGSNHSTENLSVYTNLDSASDKLIYNWKKGGSSLAVLNMPFEGHSGNENALAKDYSGNGNDAAVGADWLSTGGLDSKGAYNFDSSGDMITLSDSNSLDVSTFSVSAWFSGSANNFGSNDVERESSSVGRNDPQFQVVGEKMYFVWIESASSYDQIFTAEMTVDGTGWSKTQRTTSSYDKAFPMMQVVEGTIYYAWSENNGSYQQIWTAEMDIGSSWKNVKQQTATNSHSQLSDMHITDDMAYYTWTEGDPTQMWTADAKTYGSSFDATEQDTNSLYNTGGVRMHIVGNEVTLNSNKIFYVYMEQDSSSDFQLHLVDISRSGSGWDHAQLTSSYDNTDPQIQVGADKVYYVWIENNAGTRTLKFARSDHDGSPFTAVSLSSSTSIKSDPQFQVVGDKVYYIWGEYDGSNTQIWTGRSNVDGTSFTKTKKTTDAVTKRGVQLQVVGDKVYYLWFTGNTGTDNQIWTAEEGATLVGKGDAYGLSISDDNEVSGYIGTYDYMEYSGNGMRDIGAIARASFTPSGFHHAVTTYDGSNLKLYLDGVLKTTTAYSGTVKSNTLKVLIGTGLQGNVDEVLILDSVLTSEQISSMYDSGSYDTSKIVSQETSVGDVWQSCVTPTDSTSEGSTVCSNSLTILENVVPSVSNLIPGTNAVFTGGDTIEIAADVTDSSGVQSVYANISYPNGTDILLTLNGVAGNKYNNSFIVPILNGTYGIGFIATDINSNVNNVEATFFLGESSIPSVFNIVPVSGYLVNVSSVVLVGADVNDSYAIDSVYVNVTAAIGNYSNYTLLTNTGGDTYSMNFSFSEADTYNVVFVAKNNISLINYTESTSIVVLSNSSVVNSSTANSSLVDSNIIRGSNVTGSNLKNVTVNNSDVNESIVTDTVVIDSDLLSSTVTNSSVSGSDITNTPVVDCVIVDANITDVYSVNSSTITNSTIKGGIILDSILTNSTFAENVTIVGSTIIGCDTNLTTYYNVYMVC